MTCYLQNFTASSDEKSFLCATRDLCVKLRPLNERTTLHIKSSAFWSLMSLLPMKIKYLGKYYFGFKEKILEIY